MGIGKLRDWTEVRGQLQQKDRTQRRRKKLQMSTMEITGDLHPKDTAPLACFTRRVRTDFTACSPETGTNLSLHEGLEDTLLLS